LALLTDGRMSGASGKVLAAIQVSPEALHGGTIGKIRNGDRLCIDAKTGVLSVEATGDDVASRTAMPIEMLNTHVGMGRALFGAFWSHVGTAESGAGIFRAE